MQPTMIQILTTPLTKGMAVLSIMLMMTGIAHSEQTSCTELNKCGWCSLDLSKKGQDSVQLTLRYANQFSLRQSGYISRQDFPRWQAGPKGYNSTLPIYLRVEKISDSTVITDQKLDDVHVRYTGDGKFYTRTIGSLTPNTSYTAFAYAKYEGGQTQGYTYEKPFVKICFKTQSDESSCLGGTVHRWNVVTKSVFVTCARNGSLIDHADDGQHSPLQTD